MQQQIDAVGMLPYAPYVSALHIRRDNTGEHWMGNLEIRGAVVKHGQYNNYFRNARGQLQCRSDVYNFRWKEGSLPELVAYHVFGTNKSWRKPNPENKYITFK